MSQNVGLHAELLHGMQVSPNDSRNFAAGIYVYAVLCFDLREFHTPAWACAYRTRYVCQHEWDGEDPDH